jgi:trimeric autotransporter adhesin
MSIRCARHIRLVSTSVALTIGAAAVIVIALDASSAFAACVLPSGTTPGSCSYSGTGPALTVTDSASSTATPSPSALRGIATGTGGHAVIGTATGKNGIGGYFQADAPSTAATSTTALEAVNSGGSTSAEGKYGSAGVFTLSNAKNESPGVAITTNGINSYGLRVINNGTVDFNFNSGQQNNYGGMAGYFEITSFAAYDQSAVYAIATGDQGTAGTFITSNASNSNYTLFAQTAAPEGNAITGIVTGTGGSGAGVQGYDQTSTGGTGVYGESSNGLSAYFVDGSGGVNGCSYDGGATWSCSAPATMMRDRAKPNLGELLDRLDAMPVNYYRLKGAKAPERYLGPSAEDFGAAFGLGKDDKSIRHGNAYGVALVAAQGLYRKLKQDEAIIATQDARIAALEGQVAAQQRLADRLARLEATMTRLAPAANTRQAMLAQ